MKNRSAPFSNSLRSNEWPRGRDGHCVLSRRVLFRWLLVEIVCFVFPGEALLLSSLLSLV